MNESFNRGGNLRIDIQIQSESASESEKKTILVNEMRLKIMNGH